MKRLIINADDLGITAGVNRAIFELYSRRAVTSATLMAGAGEFNAAAVEAAQRHEGLGVGCHVTLVDGTPLLPPTEVPTLGRPLGNGTVSFRDTLSAFVLDLVRGRIREAEIEAEAVAQIRRLQQAGINVTHVDTHKHTHMFPRVLRPLLRAALMCGVRAIRNPFEPPWSVAATAGASLTRRAQVRLLGSQRRYFLQATERSGLVTTDGAIGVLATGSLDAGTLSSLLNAMPEGTWELICHPGYRDSQLDAAGTRLLDSRDIERAALVEIIPAAAAGNKKLSLIHFGHLADG